MKVLLSTSAITLTLLFVGACSSGETEVASPPTAKIVLAPTSANVTLGKDFYDAAGRLWVCKGKIQPQDIDAESIFKRIESNKNGDPIGSIAPPADSAPKMSVAELAAKLQPVRLVGEYEYRLAEPDTLLAEKILAMDTVPSVAGHAPAPAVGSDGVKPRHTIGTDDRYHWTATGFGASAYGHLTNNCTYTLIGPSTALSAAHCFYQKGAWVIGGVTALAANNNGPGNNDFTVPNGTYYADSLTITNEWINGAGSSAAAEGTPASHTGWDWDFAVLEFSPTRYPGNTAGWYGVQTYASGLHYILGYPSDKLYRSQWLSEGYYWGQQGARYYHAIDIIAGESGACVFRGSWTEGWFCTGIQSSHWTDGTGFQWNEARAWNATTYGFFDAYGNWP